jgi:hypothetical protein
MAVDSFSHPSEDVLNDLDPLSRALVDLSLQRGMEDAEIADVLGTDEESVLEVRVGLLRSLADKVAPEHAEDDPAELQAVVADRLYGDRTAEAEEIAGLEAAVPEHEAAEPEYIEEEPQPEPEPAPVAPQPAPTSTEPRERRSRRSLLLPLGVLAAVAAIIAVMNVASDDNGTSNKPAAQAPAPAKPKAKPQAGSTSKPKAKPVRLAAVGSGNATGTVTLLPGKRLKFKLHGLPSADGGTYQVWAYNSVIDAKPIGTPKSAKLPADAKHFRYLDISIEPADGNPNHSGRSVLRVPMKQGQKG